MPGFRRIRCITIAVRSPSLSSCGAYIVDLRLYVRLVGDLSWRDGYDFDQIKSIAKVEVRRDGH